MTLIDFLEKADILTVLLVKKKPINYSKSFVPIVIALWKNKFKK